jgi:hypothetical protein
MPFVALSGDVEGLPPLQLEEIDAKNFTVLTGFRYRDDRRGVRVTIGPGDQTDLASIPFFLRWFVGTYGKHTRAAIMHDHLWRKPTDGVERLGSDGRWATDVSGIGKVEANRLFRDSMGERPLHVLPAKRWIMWSAVRLDTLRTRMPDGAGIYTFLLLHLLLDAMLFDAVKGGRWVGVHGHQVLGAPVVLALVVFPALLSLLWFRMVGAGVIGSYTLCLLVVPIVFTVAALGVYMLAEAALIGIKLVRRAFGADPGQVEALSLAKAARAVRGLPTA